MKAWRVSGFGQTGIMFAESRGQARIRLATELVSMCGYDMVQAIKGLKVCREKGFDNAKYCGNEPNIFTCYTESLLEKEDV